MDVPNRRSISLELPPIPDNREHVTEPSWIEEMIGVVDEYLGHSDTDSPPTTPKSEAA